VASPGSQRRSDLSGLEARLYAVSPTSADGSRGAWGAVVVRNEVTRASGSASGATEAQFGPTPSDLPAGSELVRPLRARDPEVDG
jgi:hypothetical protein